MLAQRQPPRAVEGKRATAAPRKCQRVVCEGQFSSFPFSAWLVNLSKSTGARYAKRTFMPLFSGSIDGNGSYHWGDERVAYALWHVTTLGTSYSIPDLGSPDLVLRLGWIAFFYRAVLPDLSTRDYFSETIWLNFTDGWWYPSPRVTGDGTSLLIYARGVRWHLLGGAEADLEVGN